MVVLFTSTFPADLGIAAYIKTCFPDVQIISHSAKIAASIDLASLELKDTVLIFLGTYWENIKKLSELNRNTSSYLFHPTPTAEIPLRDAKKGDINIDLGICKGGLHRHVANTIDSSWKTLVEPSENCKYVELVNKLFYGADDPICQDFINGIYLIEEEGTYNKFLAFFQGKVEYESLVDRGRLISKFKEDLLQNRIEGSRTGITKDGFKYAVIESTDSVNIMHRKLKERYPEVHLSVVVNVSFAKDEKDQDGLYYSIRSYSDQVSSREIAINLGQNEGGGSSTSAGALVRKQILDSF
jgi:hypothetical protein